MAEKVGFIGLGIMGGPMAQYLIEAGYELALYNRTKEKAEKLAADGTEVAGSPKEVAEACGVVITMLPDSPEVREIVAGENGVLEGIEEGSLLIDMSTTSPVATRELAREVEERGASMLDAPVSGGKFKALGMAYLTHYRPRCHPGWPQRGGGGDRGVQGDMDLQRGACGWAVRSESGGSAGVSAFLSVWWYDGGDSYRFLIEGECPPLPATYNAARVRRDNNTKGGRSHGADVLAWSCSAHELGKFPLRERAVARNGGARFRSRGAFLGLLACLALFFAVGCSGNERAQEGTQEGTE